MINHTINVDLAERTYPVYLGSGILDSLGTMCTQHSVPRHVVVLADRNSARAALRRAIASLEREGYRVYPVVMPPGERQKSLRRAAAVHNAMLKMQIPRRAAMIALGGGVVGDVGGFVASTYRRGILFVQCPTTLLSQVDSSIGGKNGVNHPLSKNAIGTYHQPSFVCSDIDLLSTLPRREIIAGLGEILKYPIVGDPALLSYIEEHLEELLAVKKQTVLDVASRCLKIKASLVAQDEKELLTDQGRVFLNVGHVIGHALETLSQYRLRHGEAVLLGILAEGRIAARREGFPDGELDRFVAIYHRLKRHFNLRGLSDARVLRSVLGKGEARFVLPRRLGEVVLVRDVTNEQMKEGLRFLRSL